MCAEKIEGRHIAGKTGESGKHCKNEKNDALAGMRETRNAPDTISPARASVRDEVIPA